MPYKDPEVLKAYKHQHYLNNREKVLERMRVKGAYYRSLQDAGLYVFTWPWQERTTKEIKDAVTIGRALAIDDRIKKYVERANPRKKVHHDYTWSPVKGLKKKHFSLVVANDLTPLQLKAAENRMKSELLLVGSPLTSRHEEVFLDIPEDVALKAAREAVEWARSKISG